MAKDLSYRGGMNNRVSMSQESGFEVADLFQNEESIDLSSYINSANLELCDDDLFQSLFPSTDGESNVVKTEKPDPFESELSDWWTEPTPSYQSACSSAAQSPVQFLNTPPETPKSDCHTISPETIHHLGRQDRQAQFSMSRTQLTPMMIMEDHSNVVNNVGANEISQIAIKNDPDGPHLNRVYYVKAEQDGITNGVSSSALLPNLVKTAPTDPNSYEEGIYGKTYKRSLDDDDDEEDKPTKRSKNTNKDTEEYKMKRERNNIAVRKSRDKAKMKSIETQKKVSELASENKRLQERVAELTHELNTLKDILKSLPQSGIIPK